MKPLISRAIFSFTVVLFFVLALPSTARAACTSPAGSESQTLYDFTNHVLKYCDNTSWLTFAAGAAAATPWSNGGSGAIYYNGGNVGIGTAAPGVRLQVKSSAVSTDIIRAEASDGSVLANISEGGIGDSRLNMYDAGGAQKIQVHSNGDSYLTGGNVGIGTTTPASQLHLQSTVNFNPQILTEHVGATAGSAGYLILDRARGTPGTKAVVQSGDTLGTVLARGYDGAAYQNSAYMMMSVDGAVSAGNVPTSIDFYTTPAGGSMLNRMHVDADGNVGIGTTSPTSLLDISMGETVSGGMLITDPNSTVARLADGCSTTECGWLALYDDAGTESIRLFANATPSWINTGGNLGIGTTTPGVKLDVNGVIRGGVTGSGDVILLGNDAKLTDIDVANTVGLYGLQDSTIASVKLGSGGGTISGYSGNVGIGTASPGYTLHVAGDVMASGTGVDGPNIRFKNSANNTWSFDAVDATNSRFRLLTEGGASGNAERISISEAGNVGIGTSAPGYKLEVTGTALISTSLRIGAANSTGTYYACLDGSLIFKYATSCTASDVHLKENIEPMTAMLDDVMKLKPVTYDWKDQTRGKGRQLGLIAQDVERIFPNLVTTGEDGLKGIRYETLTAPLVKAIQELKAANDNLREVVEEQGREIGRLKAAQ